ncbi:MAG TPA: hypothetical protein VJT78_03190, partial [Candidatus Dormibacteraeota bacterium]|nr:hypothetical protein [Candidatus Dormibacteraeota bacterium]
MESEPQAESDTAPPDAKAAAPEAKGEEPARAAMTRETTPIWARTVPVAPAADDNAGDAISTADPLPAVPMEKGEPDWAHTETSPPEDPTRPDTAVPQKATPEWARTVPSVDDQEPPSKSPPGQDATVKEMAAQEPTAQEPAAQEPAAQAPASEAVESSSPPAASPAAPLTDPPKAVAADAAKATWPPAADHAEAPPEETDI